MQELMVRTGVDLQSLEEFRASVQRGGDALLRRLFHPSELAGADVERLAGVFAVKEAAFKALALPKGGWHVLEVRHDPQGKPYIVFAPEYDTSRIASVDMSISHGGGYVVACVVALVRR